MQDDRLARVLADWCAEASVFGASVGMRRAGAPPEFAAWGVDRRNPDSPMAPNGRFRIGSVTKTFTSALLLGLRDEDALTLDATIERWLPTYPNAAHITIRSLLEHTSGTTDLIFDSFPEYRDMLLSDLERHFMPEELIELMGSLPPHAAPGAEYRYSNTDYNLLGLIAERVTEIPFAALVAHRFAEPLGLLATSYDSGVPDDLLHGWFDLESDGQPSASRARDLDVSTFPNAALITLAYAAGGMTSTLSDLLAWTEALYAGDVLSASTRAELLASPALDDPGGGCHGLGVFGYGEPRADGLFPAFGHTGNIIGSSAFVAWFPGSGTTVALHANVLEVPTDAMVTLAFELAASADV